MFSHACVILSVHRRGRWLPSRHHWLHEQEGSASRGGSESRGGLHRGGGSASGILQDMVSKQAVRILLECILVFGKE